MINIYITNNINDSSEDDYSEDEYESESEEDIEMKEDLSDEELKTKIRKKRFNEIVNKIKDTQTLLRTVNINQSPMITKDLVERLLIYIDKYVVLHKLIKGPIKAK